MVPGRLDALVGSIHPVPVWNRGNIPLHFYRSWFTSLLRNVNPDAIYVHHEPYGLATAQLYFANARVGNVPIGFYAAQNIDKQYPWPIAKLEQWVLSRSSFCFPVTEGALSVLRRKGYNGAASVLPLAVDSELYFPHHQAAVEIRDRLGIGSDTFIIGFLGRIVKAKGLITLVRALSRIPQFPWMCLVVGSGNDKAQLEKEIGDLGLTDRIRLIGYVSHDEGPKWLSVFDVLVLASESSPNWKEQFGRVLVEANACGTPVIGSECGEIPAVIRHTGGGLIVPEANPERLSLAILELLRNQEKRNAFAKQGQTVVQNEYSQRHLATQFATVIEDSVRRSRR